jgi:hypothetical protein
MQSRISFLFLLCIVLLAGCRKVQLDADMCEEGKATETRMRGANASETASMMQSWPFFGMEAEWNCDWVALIPQAYVRQGNPELTDTAWTYALSVLVPMAHARGLKVMLKPHIDVDRSQTHRGVYELESEEDWDTFAALYDAWIMDMAATARDLDVDLFCVGTELKSFVLKRPDFWTTLIDKVSLVYPGPLTYAANWDEYGEMHFWDQMDYIGVDAYFPLVDAMTPNVEDLVTAWEGERRGLLNMHRSHCKPILFTEMGYRSADYATWEHWTITRPKVNLTAQAHGYEALFRTFWEDEWVAGYFVWDWRSNRIDPNNAEWTPQDKPAADVIADWFGK